ncbi:MAG: class I SAM-dependent methyltransferase [Gudongella sp.]|nr:class I SAM-dependent methyltransferase [Gudongella sp.]
MKLSNRLETILKLIPQNSIVADIGTDHGYIPRELIKNKISKFVIATDISAPSLEKTKEIVKNEDLDKSIDTRLGDGLSLIKEFEVDVVLIAGMGGILISEILTEAKQKLDTFGTYILQPMVGADELRKYLINNGFRIVDEELAKEEDRIYEIIVAQRGLQAFTNEIDYEINPLLIEKNHPFWRELILNRIKQKEKVVEELKQVQTEKSGSRLEDLLIEIHDYLEVLKSEGKSNNN